MSGLNFIIAPAAINSWQKGEEDRERLNPLKDFAEVSSALASSLVALLSAV